MAFSAMAQEHVRIGDIDDSAASRQSDAPAHVRRLMHMPRGHHETEADIPTLTKAELAELMCDQVGLNKREAKDIVDWFFDEIGHAQERGASVKLTGFGNFQLRDKAERPGRNPEDRRRGEHSGAPRRHISEKPKAQYRNRRICQDVEIGTRRRIYPRLPQPPSPSNLRNSRLKIS